MIREGVTGVTLSLPQSSPAIVPEEDPTTTPHNDLPESNLITFIPTCAPKITLYLEVCTVQAGWGVQSDKRNPLV